MLTGIVLFKSTECLKKMLNHNKNSTVLQRQISLCIDVTFEVGKNISFCLCLHTEKEEHYWPHGKFLMMTRVCDVCNRVLTGNCFAYSSLRVVFSEKKKC